jgi:hypothetical protein
MEQNSVVIKQQDQIEIYQNEDDGISIKQSNYPNDDSVIWFSVEHAELICAAIEERRKQIMVSK